LENSGHSQHIDGFDIKNFGENFKNCDTNTELKYTVEKCKQLCRQQVFKNTFYKLIKIYLFRLVITTILIWEKKQ
jgi:hypothetical protein